MVPPSMKGKLLFLPIWRALAGLGKVPPGQGRAPSSPSPWQLPRPQRWPRHVIPPPSCHPDCASQLDKAGVTSCSSLRFPEAERALSCQTSPGRRWTLVGQPGFCLAAARDVPGAWHCQLAPTRQVSPPGIRELVSAALTSPQIRRICYFVFLCQR